MTHRILTVDDSRTIRTIVKNAFKAYDCEVFEAENGRDGLALAAQILPDLIILDITMPVMTGIEMLGKLMLDTHLKDTAVIMLTAESGRDNVMSIVKLGVRDYIVKPFKGEQLIERVKLIVDDLKPRLDTGEGQRKKDDFFAIVEDMVVLTLPGKINRTVASEIEVAVKAMISQMTRTGTRKLIFDLSPIASLSMTAIQAILNLVDLCIRAKLSIRLTATGNQAQALKGFKETSTIPIKPSIEEALTDF
jgi:DNA-binding response OmpR family regulator